MLDKIRAPPWLSYFVQSVFFPSLGDFLFCMSTFECSAHGLVPLTVILIPCTHPSVVLFQAGCEVPLDPAIPAASIEHQHVVVETAEQFAGTDARNTRKLVLPIKPRLKTAKPVNPSSSRRLTRRIVFLGLCATFGLN